MRSRPFAVVLLLTVLALAPGGALAVGADTPPPNFDNVVRPTISGTASVGATLTATPGTWAPDYPYEYAYTWVRCPPPEPGNSCSSFSTSLGGHAQSYTVTAYDAGCLLKVMVMATAGAVTRGPAPSAPTAALPGGPCDTLAGPGSGGSGGGGGSAAPVKLADVTLPPVMATFGAGYDILLVEAGTPPYSFTVTSGTFPAGLVARADGFLGGVPRAQGRFAWTFRVTDARGTTAEREYTLTVTPSNVNGALGPVAPAHAVHALRTLTPGATDPTVRQATIRTTICRPGWARAQRPPASYLLGLKQRQMPLYQLSGPASAYVEDHLIPLELGGAARDPRNLWPEPAARARQVDELERRLNHAVCAGTTSLKTARERITRIKRTLG